MYDFFYISSLVGCWFSVFIGMFCLVLMKAMSHDATSFIGFGFMKPVSLFDRAKNVLQGTFKSHMRLFFTIEHCFILATCFVKLLPINHSYFPLFQFIGGNQLLYFASTW